MSFKPQNNYILLDGKYRFAEYAKFKQQDLLPCFFVDSEDCCKNIVLEKDLIAYKILKKLQTIEAFLKGEACLSELENIC